MTALGFALIGVAVVLAALADYVKWRMDSQKFTDDQLRRILRNDK